MHGSYFWLFYNPFDFKSVYITDLMKNSRFVDKSSILPSSKRTIGRDSSCGLSITILQNRLSLSITRLLWYVVASFFKNKSRNFVLYFVKPSLSKLDMTANGQSGARSVWQQSWHHIHRRWLLSWQSRQSVSCQAVKDSLSHHSAHDA